MKLKSRIHYKIQLEESYMQQQLSMATESAEEKHRI